MKHPSHNHAVATPIQQHLFYVNRYDYG